VDAGPALLLQQTQQRQGGNRFARAGFPNDGQRLAALQAERQIAHRLRHLTFVFETNVQVADVQHGAIFLQVIWRLSHYSLLVWQLFL